MIENWKTSGQSQQLFCKENQIAYSNFHYWFKEYKVQQGGSSEELFLPVQIKKTLPSPAGVVMELVLGDGRRLNFYQTVDASYPASCRPAGCKYFCCVFVLVGN